LKTAKFKETKCAIIAVPLTGMIRATFLKNDIDLATNEHYKAVIRKMESIMDEIEVMAKF